MLEREARYHSTMGVFAGLLEPVPTQPLAAPPPPPPPGPYPYQFSFPPPPTPQPVRDAILAAVIVLGVVAPLLFVWGILPLGGGYPCSHCPGNTPLGSALAVGNVTHQCSGGANVARGCQYRVETLAADSGVSPQDINTGLVNSSGALLAGLLANVSIEAPSGCTISVWSFEGTSSGYWKPPPMSGRCNNSALSSPLSVGDQFIFVPVLSSTPSLSGDGYSFVLIGVGPFSGVVSEAIP